MYGGAQRMAAVQVRPAVTPKKAVGLCRWIRGLVLTGCMGAFLTACVAPGSPVVTDRSLGKSGQTTYTVARGDTLYSIAWRFNLDYRRFAAVNQVGPPFTIYPGQELRLTDVTPVAVKTTGPTATVAEAPSKPQVAPKQPVASPPTAKASAARRPELARAVTKAPQKAPAWGSNTWHQPLAQKPSVVFGKNSKGLDYAISSRARVRNTRSGEVVYAGNGIAGFERLVIVKHSSELLSAYSFNGKMLVAEQQQVDGGMVIAEILPRPGVGQTLHFELRRKGLPINPQTLIP